MEKLRHLCYTMVYFDREMGAFMYRNGLKRLLGLLMSVSGIIVLSPVYLVLILAIKTTSPGPIFF